MKEKEISSVVIYCLGYILFFLLASKIFGYGPVEKIVAYTASWSDSIKLLTGILTQNILLVGLMFLSLLTIFSYKNYRKNIADFFSQRFQRKGRKMVRNYSIGGILFYYLINTVLFLVLNYVGLEIPGLYGEQTTITLIQAMQLNLMREYIVAGLTIVIIGPLFEEIIYRGFITDLLYKHYHVVGIIIAALIFALSHREPAIVINLIILSLILNYIYIKTQSMRYSFIFHMLINGFAFQAIVWMKILS